MSDQTQTIKPLAGQRQDRESDAAVSACNDYLRMGPGRSLRDLFERYRQQIVNKVSAEKPPASRDRTLFEWSTTFGWQERAGAYDAEQDKAKTAEVQRIRTEGLAADHNRIIELDFIYTMLKNDLEESGLYRTDIKLSATGKEVEVEVFNKPLIDSMRGVLDDLAKETGGRKQQVSQTTLDLGGLSEDQLERIANGEDPAKVVGRG